METTKFEPTRTDLRLADIVAFGSDGRIVLLVEVKAAEIKSREAVISQLKSYLQAANTHIPFAMLVALRNAGVNKYFTRTQDFLGWLQSQSTL